MASIRCMGCMKVFDDTFDICPHCGYTRSSEGKKDFQLAPGTVLNNKYLVGEVQGNGENGITYLGWDTILDKKVAIKEYYPKDLATRLKGENTVSYYDGDRKIKYEKGLESFLNTGNYLSRFNYIESIVHVFDSFPENNTGYVVMEWLEGVSALDAVNKQGKKDFKETINMMYPILEALAILHNSGMIHGNISPENIWITNDGVKLIDFNFEIQSTADVKKTVVSKGFSPVESYRSNGKLGPWTDIYAICATLYFMLTAKRPVESVQREDGVQLQEITKYAPNIPPFCVNALMNGLNVDPRDRIQSAEKLAAILSGSGKMGRIKGRKKKKNDGKKSKKGAIIAAILAVVLLVGAGTTLFFVLNNGDPIKSSDASETFEKSYFVGKTTTEAKQYIKQHKKNMKIIIDGYNTKKGDNAKLVIGTIVNADVDDKNNTITLYVYNGENKYSETDVNGDIVIRDVENMDKDKAIGVLETYYKDRNKIHIKEVEDDNNAGKVISQSVGGKIKEKDISDITITVGIPTPTTTVAETEPPTEYQYQDDDSYNDYNAGNDYVYNNNSNADSNNDQSLNNDDVQDANKDVNTGILG